MDERIETFCSSAFTKKEKQKLFFPVQPRICHSCKKPKAKKHINFDNFSKYHKKLICMCVFPRLPGDHGGAAPGDHGGEAPGGHDNEAPGGHDDADLGGHGGGGHGGHGGGGHGGHNNFVTIAQFTAFQNQITDIVNHNTNSINQLTDIVNHNTNSINQLTNNINQINNNINNILNILNNNNIN